LKSDLWLQSVLGNNHLSHQLVAVQADVSGTGRTVRMLMHSMQDLAEQLESNTARLAGNASTAASQFDALRTLVQRIEADLARQQLELATALERVQAVVDATAQRRSVLAIGEHELLVQIGAAWVLSPADDPAVVKSLIDPPERERALRDTISRAASSGAIVVDGAAGLGAIAVPVAHSVRSSGRVVAVEPDPDAAARLRRSLELNDLGAVAEVREELGELELAGDLRVVIRSEASAASLSEVLDACDRVGEQRSMVVLVEFGTETLEVDQVMMRRWLDDMTTRGFRWRLIDPSTGRLLLVGADDVASSDGCLLLFARPDDLAELGDSA
jgi:FkbM family methyltransferase